MEKKTKMETNTKNSFIKKIDKTVYHVTLHFSETSRETVQDKIKRLILRDIQSGNY